MGRLPDSQLSHKRWVFVDRVLREGEHVKVMIAECNADGGTLSLSTKALERTAGEEVRLSWMG